MIKSVPCMSNNRMIAEQIERRGVTEPRLLAAMRSVDRALFVPPEASGEAYEDCALPIDLQQTISQPYIVAFMTAALEVRPDDRVLEIGAGTGYQSAILGRLAKEVWSLEVLAELAHTARPRLRKLGVRNVSIVLGNGWEGLPERSPYDRILAAAAAPHVPEALMTQLGIGGRLVMPVGVGDDQNLVLITRPGSELYERRVLAPARFVPMIYEPEESLAIAPR